MGRLRIAPPLKLKSVTALGEDATSFGNAAYGVDERADETASLSKCESFGGSSTELPLVSLQESVQRCMGTIEQVLSTLGRQVTVYFDRIDELDTELRRAQTASAVERTQLESVVHHEAGHLSNRPS